MNTLNDNIALVKASFKGIRDAINNSCGKDVTDMPVSDYAAAISFVPSLIDANGTRTTWTSFFEGRSDIIRAPAIDTSQGRHMGQLHYGNAHLKYAKYDLTNLTNTYQMFGYCVELEQVDLLNMSAAGTPCTTYYMFHICRALKTITGLNLTYTSNTGSMFTNCYALENITLTGTIPVSIFFSASPLLTHDSLMNIINALADVTGGTAQVLILHATSTATLTTEEIAIATAKNWSIT